MKRSILVRGTAVLLGAALMIGNVNLVQSVYAGSSVRKYKANAATDTQLDNKLGTESDDEYSYDDTHADAADYDSSDYDSEAYEAATSNIVVSDGNASYITGTDYSNTSETGSAGTAVRGSSDYVVNEYSYATETEYRYATETEYRYATETEYSNDIALTSLVQNGNNYEVSTADDFTTAISKINKSSDGGTIILKNDISLSTDKKIDIKKDTTILGEGHSLRTNCTLVVNKDTSLTLGKLYGGDQLEISRLEDASRSLVNIDGNSSSRLSMHEGVTLDGGQYSIGQAAVYVASSGVFQMYGGTIKNCFVKYGAVYLESDSCTFSMSGNSVITNCGLDGSSKSPSEAGAIYSDKGVIEMSGGSITDCKGRLAGAIYSYSGKTNIHAGSISNCTSDKAGAIYMFASEFVIYTSPILNMYGGTITGNKGGLATIFAYMGKITIDGGSIVDNNGVGIKTEGGLFSSPEITLKA